MSSFNPFFDSPVHLLISFKGLSGYLNANYLSMLSSPSLLRRIARTHKFAPGFPSGCRELVYADAN